MVANGSQFRTATGLRRVGLERRNGPRKIGSGGFSRAGRGDPELSLAAAFRG
jgi:hypothetical protein